MNAKKPIRMNLNCTLFLILLMAAMVCRASAAFPNVHDLPVQTNLPDVMTMSDGSRVTTPGQ